MRLSIFKKPQNVLARSVRKSSSAPHPSTRTTAGTLNAHGASIEAERCLLCVDAPCAKACPAGTRPDKFLRQLRFDNPHGAAETVLDNNALGGVCGTVCPVSKLCEGACTRKAIDGPVKIGAVQRYLHDFGIKEHLSLPPVPSVPSGHRTAVIGGGPAGLSAARELARKGSTVTVFERREKVGGALNHALSPLRMPHSLVDEEVRRIADMGVRFECNANIDDIDALLSSQHFDAVFVSPGLQDSIKIHPQVDPLGRWSVDGVHSALHFLGSANSSTNASVASEISADKHVLIVGGGSVAMDCAITARGLGASRVTIVMRESMLNMRADEEEVRLARECGCTFMPETEVVQLRGADTVELRGAAALNATLNVQSIIVAAGQILDESGQKLLQVLHSDGTSSNTTSTKNSVNVADTTATNSTSTTSSTPRVFFGGDAVRRGGDTVVQAIADGKHAADLILPNTSSAERQRISLRNTFLGITYENPFCLSSSPVTNSAEMIARAYDAGFAGSYYKTLNREDKFAISHPSPRLAAVHNSSSYSGHGGGIEVGIQNMEQISDRPLADNLKDIEWLRVHYPNKITGVSIMGYCDEDWEYLAKAAEGAGAHLLELNFSCPQMARSDAGVHVGQQFDLIERYCAVVRRATSLPVVAKLTPNITDMIPAALAAKRGGAHAVSAINTVKSISHVDLDTLVPTPTIKMHSAISGFSGKGCRPIGLRFVSELARAQQLEHMPISGMGGVYTWKDAVEYMSLGASNIQVTTSVMQHGVRIVEDLILGTQLYLGRAGMSDLSELVGLGNRGIVSPQDLDAESEVVSVIDPQLCIGCGACEVSCRDGAAQAISMHDITPNSGLTTGSINTSHRTAQVNKQLCVGCKMCQFVCPVNAISFQTRPRINRPRFSK